MKWVITDLWQLWQDSDLLSTYLYLFSDSWNQIFIPYMDSHRNHDFFTEVLSYCRTRAKKSGNGEEERNQAKIPFLQESMICFMTSDMANKQKSWKPLSCLWLKHTEKCLSSVHIKIVSSKTYLKSLGSMVDANDTLWYMNGLSRFFETNITRV